MTINTLLLRLLEGVKGQRPGVWWKSHYYRLDHQLTSDNVFQAMRDLRMVNSGHANDSAPYIHTTTWRLMWLAGHTVIVDQCDAVRVQAKAARAPRDSRLRSFSASDLPLAKRRFRLGRGRMQCSTRSRRS